MTAPDSRWRQIDRETDKAASVRREPGAIRTRLIRLLKALAARQQCSPNAVGWIMAGHSITFSPSSADARDVRGHPAIRLQRLSYLNDGAVLSLQVVLNSHGELTEYAVGIWGCKPEGTQWYARIDMGRSPEGEGPCGHPLLHCHIGVHPDDTFQPRVPLPWLEPDEALRWLLATLDSRHEPADPGGTP